MKRKNKNCNSPPKEKPHSNPAYLYEMLSDSDLQ